MGDKTALCCEVDGTGKTRRGASPVPLPKSIIYNIRNGLNIKKKKKERERKRRESGREGPTKVRRPTCRGGVGPREGSISSRSDSVVSSSSERENGYTIFLNSFSIFFFLYQSIITQLIKI